MLLGVVARAFRRLADAAAFSFTTALGSPTATVAYKGNPASVDVETALGAPFGAKGHQASATAYAVATALGSPSAITGKTGNPAAIEAVTALGSPTAKAAYQGSPANVGIVFGFPNINILSYVTEAQAIFDNFDTTPATARLNKINACVSGLIDDGVWAIYDRLWVPFAHEAGYSWRMDWKNPGVTGNALTAVNSPTFTADQGATGNGTSSYFNTNYNTATDGVNFTRNSASIGVWVRSTGGVARQFIMGVGTFGGAGSAVISREADGTGWRGIGVNDNGNFTATTLSQNATGLLSVNRSASSAKQLYRNGSLEQSATTSSQAPDSDEMFILASHNGGAINYFSGQISMAYAGGSMTSTQQANQHSRFSTLFA